MFINGVDLLRTLGPKAASRGARQGVPRQNPQMPLSLQCETYTGQESGGELCEIFKF